MRILALDFGDVRIGVAISDEMGWTAQGVGFIKRASLEKDLKELERVIQPFGTVDEIVVGMPFNMDGSEGERVHKTRKFCDALSKRFNIPIIEVDERLSSMEAEKLMISSDVSRSKRKGKIDQLAASIILQTYLSTRMK
ncbi:MAG: Holliday junction resolvase RuvX [Oligoflexia bacterium]|nr:Holliday junction resolvase RuvX [Oligoflexia bacterium]